MYPNLSLIGSLLIYGFPLTSGFSSPDSLSVADVAVTLDREEKQADGSVLTSSTQSLNRYFSVLRQHAKADVAYDSETNRLSLGLKDDKGSVAVTLKNIDAGFMVPLLPYPHNQELDELDEAVLMLAEYSRNGINLSYHEENDKVGFFYPTEGLFNNEEYLFEEGEVKPNPKVLPKRIQIVHITRQKL